MYLTNLFLCLFFFGIDSLDFYFFRFQCACDETLNRCLDIVHLQERIIKCVQ